MSAKVEKSVVRFRGRVITVSVDEVVLPNGNRVELEMVRHPGGAAVVALDDEFRVCLLRQYRYAAADWVWELPAGKLEPNEPPLRTAQRELIEEAGVSAREWRCLGRFFSSPGILDEVLHIFLATGIDADTAAPEAAEVFEVHWVPFAQAHQRVLSGEIRDAKTALGLMHAYHQADLQAELRKSGT